MAATPSFLIDIDNNSSLRDPFPAQAGSMALSHTFGETRCQGLVPGMAAHPGIEEHVSCNWLYQDFRVLSNDP
jgi:hypothetical protein